ncbi:short-chain dehydrogenase [Xylanibacillus composti]|uniref:Short-chain dehydrogenase n=1 Tax=Xylanibacillus composti TaxID=1572762 RepID=A0A8J4H4Y0_9BACL|nr:SDR family NAD(P)-dependent oxidoreductase [Xylanibacillus composti]GIQ69582.1 short-chain dehydrogenase [Xylanibacillus composti]
MTKYACVTGADRGVGLALVREFVNRGFHVFAGQYMPHQGQLEALKAEFPEQIDIVDLNVADDASVKAAAQLILSKTDKLEMLVNNAAILGKIDDSILDEEMDFDQILQVINVSGLGALRVTHALIKAILNSEHKLVVNISSEAGSIGQCYRTGWYGYAMAKAALNMHAVTTHNCIKERGGQVLNFHPGWVKSYLSGTYTDHATLTPEQSAADLAKLIFDHKKYMGDKPAFIDNEGKTQLW